VARHPDWGWLAFGGNVRARGEGQAEAVVVEPRDASRARVYLAPLGLWLTLDTGRFESVTFSADQVILTLEPATPHTTAARLRIEQPAAVAGVGTFQPVDAFATERGALLVPLDDTTKQVRLRDGG